MRITSPFGVNSYIPGSGYGLCDECGFKYRLEEMRKRWDGAFVCQKDWEPRHPQEFLRGKQDRIKHPGPIRPEPTDVFVTTEVTQDDL